MNVESLITVVSGAASSPGIIHWNYSMMKMITARMTNNPSIKTKPFIPLLILGAVRHEQ